MELGEAEPFGALDHYHRGIGDIDTHFDDGGGDKDVCPAGRESIHVQFLDFRGLLAVDNGHLVLRKRKSCDNLLITCFQIAVVHLFAFEYQRIDNENLTSLGNLVFHEVVQHGLFAFSDEDGLHRFPARRHLVYHGDVKVAVESHRQSPRDGCGCHHKDVRRNPVASLCPKPGSLLDSEPVLLVDDCKTEIPEYDGVLDQCMGPDDDSDAAVFQTFEDRLPFGFGRGSDQQAAGNPGRGEVA